MNYLPPTREELNNSRRRIILFNGVETQIDCTLAQLSWCTKWIDTRMGYITVHEITQESIMNALAAGYTCEEISKATKMDVRQFRREILTLTNYKSQDMFDAGQYSLNGKYAEAAHMYMLMYHVCNKTEDRLRHMLYHQSLNKKRVVIKPASLKKSIKRPNSSTEEVISYQNIRDDLDMARNIKIKNRTTIQFTLERTSGHYECRFLNVSDVTDIWPNRSGKLVDVFDYPQVVDAGDIVETEAQFYWTREGLWSTDVTDDEVQEQLTKKNAERTIRIEKGQHGLGESLRTLYDAGSDHFVVCRETKQPSTPPLGVRTSFWTKLEPDPDVWNIKDFIQRRKINPYEESDTAPQYGKIRHLESTFNFRASQESALGLMFRDNKLHSGIYILPCGAGKTLLGIAAAVRTGGRRTLVLVPNETIERQWKKRFFDRARVRARTLKEIGRMSMKKMHTSRERIVAVVSCNMLAWKCLGDDDVFEGSRMNPLKIAAVENALFCHWDLIIIDEVHNMRTPQNLCLLSKLSYSSIIGLTATATKETKYPWHVDVAPVIYETAWPLQNAYVINKRCKPWLPDIFGNICQEINSIMNTSEQKTQRTHLRSRIYQNMAETKNLPTYMTKYETMIEFNPNKLAIIEQIIHHHEQAGQPIIIFANAVEHMKIFRRRFVKMPIHYKSEKFGDYFRDSLKQYLYRTVHRKYMEAVNYNFTDSDVFIQYDEWQEHFVENWNPAEHKNNQEKMFQLCPDTPFDGLFALHFMEQLQREEEELLSRVKIICRGVKIEDIKTVTQSQYAELFFLFDTPRWVMFGQDEARNIPTTHRHHVYEKFKRGDIKTLFLTRIGNEGVDLPNARVIIIASGQGTSETEDAQRFGRALRGVEESKDGRFLYEVYTDTNTVVHLSDDLNREKIYAEKRETFLRNRGYTIRDEIVQVNEIIYNNKVTNTFFMTQQIKNQWQANTLELILDTLPGYTKERLVIGTNSCLYKRRQNEHDNNLIMAEYIARELGYNLAERELRTSTVYQ